ncbi:DUF3846 domain-containing protein [Microbacterium rhizosphaerae]|uniref:DUF3846 domain-containing protein n=1 Tax=Microbacterium rhizosphaerae TaxID=1678237 RepID=A0ABZ0SPR3_9MICO|nr:DUF3846 domain-containing protein [Microbacterium rhizosphaerae]WPR91319.1 DUF3846 domain-containing protein [Microbacterium rhizosphaerae]
MRLFDEPVELREFSSLEDYQAAVGGWIEPVDLLDLGTTVYINEEGLLRQLPFNSRATFLWWYHVPEARQRAMLAGDAVLVGLPDSNGDSTDLPGSVSETLAGSGTWRVEVRTVGDPKWYGNQATYVDYFEALVWAMLTLERWTAAEDVRVVPVLPDELPQPAA